MLYQDRSGKILSPEEVEDLAPYEIDMMGIHILDERDILVD